MPTPWVTLSTITGWPSRSVNLLPSVRATRSGLPPGAVGMMILIGRVGQFGVCATDGPVANAAAVPERNALRVNAIVSPDPDCGLSVAGANRQPCLTNSCATPGPRPGRPIAEAKNIRLAFCSLLARQSETYGQGRISVDDPETPLHERTGPHVRRGRRYASAAVQAAPARPFRAVAHRPRDGAPSLRR